MERIKNTGNAGNVRNEGNAGNAGNVRNAENAGNAENTAKDVRVMKVRHKKLICVDSDGCAFDSMESKHRTCFGPQIWNVWPLCDRKEQVLDAWNHVNLYSSTRAVNRFKGLALVLKELGEEDWKEIHDWTMRAEALSNLTLREETHPALKRALEWSLAVNEAIAQMPLSSPFDGAKEAVLKASGAADVVVVSSTNPDALSAEWSNAGLGSCISAIMSHRDGPKKTCIEKLIRMGYRPEDVIMLGDAPGDYQAAMENRVHFYPICPRRETEDWHVFEETVFPLFVAGMYGGDIEQRFIERFWKQFEE